MKNTLLTIAVGLAGFGLANAADKPNILVIWGDDVGQTNISAYSRAQYSYIGRGFFVRCGAGRLFE
jgi:hypothetical protein